MQKPHTLPLANLHGERILVHIELPPDVISRREETVWDHKEHPNKPNRLSWDRQLINGKLSDPIRASLLEMCRRYYCYLRVLRPRVLDRATAMMRMNVVFQLIDWLISIGCSSFSTVSAAAVQTLVDSIDNGITVAHGEEKKIRARPGTVRVELAQSFEEQKNTRLTKAYLSTLLGVIHELFELYRFPLENGEYVLNDGFQYSLYDDFEAALTDGKRRGSDQQQTDDIDEEAVFAYTDAALQYVFDYSDELIQLQELADGLSPPTSSRVSPGERIALLAELMAGEVLKEVSQLLPVDGPAYSRIALYVGVNVTYIYHPRFKSLILETLRVREGTVTEKHTFVQRLSKIAKSSRQKVKKTPVRTRDAGRKIGLPYSGKLTGSASPWPITTIGASRHSSHSLEAAITDLWTSVSIIIFAWQAERTGQVLDLDVDCLEQGVDGWYLKSRVFKDRNDLIGSETRHACPDVVVKAIQLVIRLGAKARQETGSKKLFLRDNRLRDSISDQTSLRNRMADFGKRHVRSGVLGNIKIIPRHFRRFFPTLWVNYYSFGGRFRALQRHLNHADLTTTVLYSRRIARPDIVRESQTRMTTRLFGESLLSGLPLIGGGLKKVQSIIARLDFRLSAPDDVLHKLEKGMKREAMRVYPLPFGYCLWDRHAFRTARCRQSPEPGTGKEWPPVNKVETVCGECFNFLTTPTFETFWSQAYDRHKAMEEDIRTPRVLKKLARKGRRISEKFLKVIRAQKL